MADFAPALWIWRFAYHIPLFFKLQITGDDSHPVYLEAMTWDFIAAEYTYIHADVMVQLASAA